MQIDKDLETRLQTFADGLTNQKLEASIAWMTDELNRRNGYAERDSRTGSTQAQA